VVLLVMVVVVVTVRSGGDEDKGALGADCGGAV